jgi:hypothetical protein
LRAEIERRANEATYKGRPHYLVAHSHGGNIAMGALVQPDDAGKIAGVICLATPFLYIRERPKSSLAAFSVFLAQISTAWLCYKSFALIAISAGLGSALIFLILAVPTFLILAAPIFVKSTRSLMKTLFGSLTASLATSIPEWLSERTLLLAMAGDEATGSLKAAQFLTWAAHRIWGSALFLIVKFRNKRKEGESHIEAYWIQYAWLALTLIVVLALSTLTPEKPNGRIWTYCAVAAWSMPWWLPIALIILSVPLTMFSCILTGLAYGWELGLLGPHADVVAEPTPEGIWPIRMFAPRFETRDHRLIHSVYDDPRVIEQVCKFVTTKVETGSVPPPAACG